MHHSSGRAQVIVLSGAPLHGKTATARALARIADFKIVDVDAVRKRQFPSTSGVMLEPDDEIHVMIESYTALFDDVDHYLARHESVVIPATFSRAEFKQPLLDFLKRRSDIRTLVCRLTVGSLEEIDRRLESRAKDGGLSPITTTEMYQWALTLSTPWPEDVSVMGMDTDGGAYATAHRILNIL